MIRRLLLVRHGVTTWNRQGRFQGRLDPPLDPLGELEATYLAWVDLRAYGHADPAAVALERGRVRLAAGDDYQPGLPGHVRLNIATSPERLTEIVHRTADALTRD